MNAMALLKPGGLAVHTFEFSLTHVAPAGAARHGGTSLWTRADVEGLARDLCFLGYEVLPLRCAARAAPAAPAVALPLCRQYGMLRPCRRGAAAAAAAVAVHRARYPALLPPPELSQPQACEQRTSCTRWAAPGRA